jgi:hypothetical protein
LSNNQAYLKDKARLSQSLSARLWALSARSATAEATGTERRIPMTITSSVQVPAEAAIQPHNAKPASVWSSGGARYDQISRGIADSIEHCVLRLNPQPGERVLDLATGTGWTSRLVAGRGPELSVSTSRAI